MFNSKSQKIISARLLLFGHGAKPFGHALLDEVFPLFFIKSIIKNIHNFKSNLSFFIGAYLFINSSISVFLSEDWDLYRLHILYISCLLILISQFHWRKYYFNFLTLPAILYLAINFCFVIAEQHSFISIGLTAADCRISFSSDHPCFLKVAFWQDYWTGTAYSSLGLWISAAVLLRNSKTIRVKYFFLVLYLFVAFFQMSKAMILGSICLLPFFVRNSKHLFYLAGLLSVLVMTETMFWVISATNHQGGSVGFLNVAKQSYTLSTLGYFDNYVIDPARLNQLVMAFNHFSSDSMFVTLFGNFSGFHRTGMQDSVALAQSSFIFRPVGLLIWVVDYGIVFVILFFAKLASTIMRLIFSFQENGVFFPLNLIFVTLFVHSYPLITNIDDSILFWFLVFHPTFLQTLYTRKYN